MKYKISDQTKKELQKIIEEKAEARAAEIISEREEAIKKEAVAEQHFTMQPIIRPINFPKSMEVVQSKRPDWYKDPIKPEKFPKSIEVSKGKFELTNEKVSVEGDVRVEGSVSIPDGVKVIEPVSTIIDWTPVASIITVAVESVGMLLGKLAKGVFRVMPAKEHYLTPQLVVLADKSGRPVSLKDLFTNHNNVQVYPAQGGMYGGGKKSAVVDLTSKYQPSDSDEASTTRYYGYLGSGGEWYIMKNDTTAGTYRYVTGTEGYEAAWTGRASLTYSLFSVAF